MTDIERRLAHELSIRVSDAEWDVSGAALRATAQSRSASFGFAATLSALAVAAASVVLVATAHHATAPTAPSGGVGPAGSSATHSPSPRPDTSNQLCREVRRDEISPGVYYDPQGPSGAHDVPLNLPTCPPNEPGLPSR